MLAPMEATRDGREQDRRLNRKPHIPLRDSLEREAINRKRARERSDAETAGDVVKDRVVKGVNSYKKIKKDRN